MPIGAATVAASAIGAGASIYSSSQAAGASDKGAKAALAYQKQIRTDVQPYLKAGTGAINTLSDPNALMKGFYASPNYQYTLGQGLNAVGTDKAVNGLLRSGSAIKALDTFASNTAANQFNNYIGQKQYLSSAGISAEGDAAGVANNSSNIAMTNAANQGNADLVAGNAFSQFGGSLATLIQKYGSPTPNTSMGSSFNAGG